ncbi:MAG: 2,3-butanediol dehydrogenase [Lachnospiraceae bacterium]|nr:2,3-butanediol dehydrogenase [Lachnospiraceae bacterium]
MKCAVYYGKNDVRLEDWPEPELKKNTDVKIKIDYCGICGSDLEEYYYGPVVVPEKAHPMTGRKMPLILGHEFSGTVESVGSAVKSVRPGDRVVVNPVLGCGECYWCKKGVPCLCESMACIGLQSDGAFAEYAVIPEDNCMLVPEGADMASITLIEPCATAIRNLKRARMKVGDNVLVIGAGTVGLLTIQAARLAGADKVMAVEVNEFRSEMALKLGADAVFSPFEDDLKKKIRGITGGRGIQIAIEITGKESSPVLALEVIEKGGTIVLVGICPEPSPLLTRNIARNEIDIFGVHGYTKDDIRDSISFISSGRIKAAELITGIIGIDSIVDKGFNKLGPNGEKEIKIIVDMNR